MRALVQRVSSACVRIDDEVVGEVGPGLCVLLGVTHADDLVASRKLAEKVWHLRVFRDDSGDMNLPVAAVGGEILVVSQFTLYSDTRRGRRPSYVDAARPEHAEPLYEAFCEELRTLGATVATGRFGATMNVELTNDGPVTILLEFPAVGA
ncbi:MAG: D-aminoacyl-tRNA deacylase [Acidimicrobiia bacterium]